MSQAQDLILYIFFVYHFRIIAVQHAACVAGEAVHSVVAVATAHGEVCPVRAETGSRGVLLPFDHYYCYYQYGSLTG